MADETRMLDMKEADRLGVIKALEAGGLRQREAARRMGVSERQVRRLLARFRERGPAGLASRCRGRPAGNAIGAGVREAVLSIVRERYADFGPTLAREKLEELHGHRLSRETLRKWMMADGLWRPRSRHAARIHQSRPRRACLGELIQIDGSPHAWFEDRGPACTLIVFIDDATGRLMAMGFHAAETTEAYMEVLRHHLSTHGRPVALYSDRHGIFRVNARDCEGKVTQFTRALRTLDIEPIHAGSPQAKGRVERANKTLQDRLVKEMRLRGIGGPEAGNAYLGEFMAHYNENFAKAPRDATDAHRPVLHDAAELDLVLCEQHQRKLSTNLAIRFEGREYQVTNHGKGYRLRNKWVTVCKGFDGSVGVLLDGRELPVRLLAEGGEATAIEDGKTVRDRVARAKAAQLTRPNWKPPPDHPWRKPYKPIPERAAAG